MKLKKIKIENIRSYESEEINFPDRSLLLSGDIGSGKSSILLAVEYALFGLQPGQKGSALLRNEADSGFVSLEIEVQDKQVLIERKLKRSGKGVSSEYSAVTIDGEKFESSTTEIKTKILEVLGYPPEFIKKNNLLYRYTVFTPQEQMKQIILEDKETRLNIIRHIFGVEKYKRIRENLLLLENHLKEEGKFLQGQISSIDEEVSSLASKKSFLGEIQIKIKQKESILQEKIRKRESLEAELSKIKAHLKEKEEIEREIAKTKILLRAKLESLSALTKESAELERSLSEDYIKFDQATLDTILKKIKYLEEEMESFNSQYVEICSNISALEKSQQENLAKKSRIFKIDICPTCLQDVPESHKHNILNETESSLLIIRRQISELEKRRADISVIIRNKKIEKQNLEDEKIKSEVSKSSLEYFKKAGQKLEQIKSLAETLKEEESLIEKALQSLKESLSSFSEIDASEKENKEHLKIALAEEKKEEMDFVELRKESEMTGKEIQRLELRIKDKIESKKKLANLIDLQAWLSKKFLSLIEFIERNVLISLRLEFSKLFAKWFEMLVYSDSLHIQVDESFTPVILHGETEMSYEFLSGGEKTAIALAYRLALNQTINSIHSKLQTRDLIILDEPTDGFSESQIDKMRDVLLDLNAPQLIIVSHEQKIESFVDDILRVRKENDRSIISDLESSSVLNPNQKTLNNIDL